MINWLKGLLNAFSKTAEVPQSVDETKVDDQVRKAKQPNRRKVSAGKSNQGAKSTRVRSNNKSKTSGKSAGTTIRAAASKSKAKSKTVSKG